VRPSGHGIATIRRLPEVQGPSATKFLVSRAVLQLLALQNHVAVMFILLVYFIHSVSRLDLYVNVYVCVSFMCLSCVCVYHVSITCVAHCCNVLKHSIGLEH